MKKKISRAEAYQKLVHQTERLRRVSKFSLVFSGLLFVISVAAGDPRLIGICVFSAAANYASYGRRDLLEQLLTLIPEPDEEE